MAAQLVDSVEEVVFTEADEMLLVVLADGRVLELFGDGVVQTRGSQMHEVLVTSI
jgi:hypothetical protein